MAHHTDTRDALIAALVAHIGDRKTDFPIWEACPILAYHEQDENETDEIRHEEAEVAEALRLLGFLTD